MDPRTISVYTDGSSSGSSDGPSGWGWILIDLEHGRVIDMGAEGSARGTNNTAELMGAIKGLSIVWEQKLHHRSKIELVCDSTYVLNLATGVFKPNTNLDLVHRLQVLFGAVGAKARWVRGHGTDIANLQVDRLAKAGKEVYSQPKPKKVRKNSERRRKRAAVKQYKRTTNAPSQTDPNCGNQDPSGTAPIADQ